MKNTIYYKFKALFVLSFVCFYANAQVKDAKEFAAIEKGLYEGEILTYCEQMPEFVGGTEKMYEYLVNTIRYPKMAQDSMVEGLVVLTFVVQKNGSITDVKQVSSPLGFGLDEEAQRVVQIMPKWSPGRQKGKRIAVMFTLPIRFKLN